ncbi:MAG: iron dependent repressor, metal binding and dimerization domain protein [Thermotaleaceae bacterium]
MLSPSLGEYIEEIYQLSLMKSEVQIRDISQGLNVSSHSVVKALRKLHREKYLYYQRHEGIRLTPQGKNLGRLLVKRNSILHEFLFILNSDCDREKEVEIMEHYLSPSTIAAIEKLVEFIQKEKAIMKKFTEFCDQLEDMEE